MRDHPHTPRLETAHEVMFFDTDAGGVVHNIAYLRFIETCRTKLGTALGLGLREMAADGRFAVVLRTEIDYLKPAILGDELIVHGWLEKLERVRFWCGFEVVRPADGARLIACRQALALVKMPEGKPLRLAADWSTRWPHLVASGRERSS